MSIEDELRGAIDGARYAKRIGVGNPQAQFLATHGDVLLAAVRLAEAVVSRYRGSLDDDAPWMAQIEAINAYRKAKETRKP